MASGFIQSGGVPLQMSRTNTRYWDAGSGQWKAPTQACYYNGSQWIPFILSIPSPGTLVAGNSEGKVFHYSRQYGQSSTYYIHPLTLLTDAGYDAAATVAAGGNVTLRMKRASDSSTTTRNISFRILVRDSSNYSVASTPPEEHNFVAQGENFSITFPRAEMTNGMFFRWSWSRGGSENTGWEFELASAFALEF